jgi:hypothetical protein
VISPGFLAARSHRVEPKQVQGGHFMKHSVSARLIVVLFVYAVDSFSPPMRRLVSATRFSASTPILRASSTKVHTLEA